MNVAVDESSANGTPAPTDRENNDGTRMARKSSFARLMLANAEREQEWFNTMIYANGFGSKLAAMLMPRVA